MAKTASLLFTVAAARLLPPGVVEHRPRPPRECGTAGSLPAKACSFVLKSKSRLQVEEELHKLSEVFSVTFRFEDGSCSCLAVGALSLAPSSNTTNINNLIRPWAGQAIWTWNLRIRPASVAPRPAPPVVGVVLRCGLGSTRPPSSLSVLPPAS